VVKRLLYYKKENSMVYYDRALVFKKGEIDYSSNRPLGVLPSDILRMADFAIEYDDFNLRFIKNRYDMATTMKSYGETIGKAISLNASLLEKL
jgi:hypothetical protein